MTPLGRHTIGYLEGEDAFAQLELAWNALWDVSMDGTASQTWTWQHSYWRYLTPKSEPRIIVARDAGGHCVALASFAMCRDRESLLQKGAFLGDKVPDYHLILARPSTPVSVGVDMLHYARSHLGSRLPLFELSNVPEDSYSGKVMREFSRDIRSSTTTTWETETFSVPLPGSIEEYQSALGARSRRDFQYDRRRLNRDFSVTFRVYSKTEDLSESLAAIEAIDRARWGADSRYSVPSYRAFTHTVSRDQCERGMYRAFVLHVNEQPVAYVLGAVVRDQLRLLSIGHDQTFPGKYSVGKVANFYAIEAAIGEDLRFYDLSRGGEAYKKWLGAVPHTNLHLRHFRSALDRLLDQSAAKLAAIPRENEHLRRMYQRIWRK